MSTIFVVGIGPGAYEKMTIEAADALRNCDVIIGYTVYVDLVKEHFAGKEFLTTPMRKEVERCRLAFETAAEGKQVAMICSGDAGVYGMAGLMYELSEEWPDIEIKVIPGVTAATGGAAVLGAPLIHDFALTMLIGVFVGTASSIYVSSAVLLALGDTEFYVHQQERPVYEKPGEHGIV